jgi:hypothetical protein
VIYYPPLAAADQQQAGKRAQNKGGENTRASQRLVTESKQNKGAETVRALQ